MSRYGVHIVLVALVTDGGLGSCPQLGVKAKGNSGKRETSFRKLRVGSWNIGSLAGKFIKLVKSLKRRKINITCIQETRWVKRISDRMMFIKLVIGMLFVNVVSAYAPHVGLDEEFKRLCWEDLDEVVRDIPSIKNIFISGDFNGHISITSNGFDDVHGGFGFGERNGGGVSLLEFSKAFELVIANSCFLKRNNQLVTFSSTVPRNQIDYLLLQKGDRGR
ncbi:uncharacterized protein LOC129894660 [Solanum dulcamara]|uniref:uncharacterized protein LOC129894660 n=1 Tax=Solanum dulcamara TaxID=45834 RepID=UPI0024866A3F|nr:uncharacterized protein LOC129894660 [Solanum dulcamara]